MCGSARPRAAGRARLHEQSSSLESITAKHWQWQAKLFRYGMLCFVAANFGPTNGLSTYGRSGVHEGETGKEEEEEE